MRSKGVLPLVALVVIVAGLLIATFVSGNSPNLGLDLQGGVSVVLQPVSENDQDVTPEALEQTKLIIEKRVNAIGVAESEVTVQGSTIVVQLPGIEDQQRALELVGQTAELRFRPVTASLAPAPSEEDADRLNELRAELEIPDGVSAVTVIDSELAARGQPTLTELQNPPDIETGEPQLDPNQPINIEDFPLPTEVPAGAPADQPVEGAAGDVVIPSGEGTGGGLSAKVVGLRQQDPTVPTAPTETAPVTTTTIDPSPLNEYGIEVYTDAEGAIDERLQELLALELAAEQSEVETTSVDDNDPDGTAILNGIATEFEGQTVVPRYEVGPTALTGRGVETASAQLQGTEWVVSVVFLPGEAGIDPFNEINQQCHATAPGCESGQLAIVLDTNVISAPAPQQDSQVFTPFDRDGVFISGGSGSGGFSQEEAQDLALALRFGSLPITLEPQQVQTVSATLGEGALSAALISGLVGLLLVLAYMIFYYRLLGVVTFLALCMAASMLWIVIAFLGESAGLTLTLAGIVGIVVSIGISIDSSIVYFENLKEEVRGGRTVRSAVDGSFNRAYSTILKADFSSLIGAGVLYTLSIGPVRGFAFYLGLATVLDLIISYVFTHNAVALLGRSKLGENPRLFGVPTDDLGELSADAPDPVGVLPEGDDA
jgi:preprotein translocase subunit SecD